MRFLFITFTLFVHLFGYDTFEIKSALKSFNSAPFTFYIQDRNNSLTPEDVLNHKNLTQLKRNGQLPNLQGPFWSRFEIKNSTAELQHLILHNILPGTNYIDVYIYKNNSLVKKHLLGDMRAQSSKELLGRHSMFELSLKADETFTIISKVDNFNVVNLSWIVSQSDSFMNKESKELIIFGLTGGFFLLFSLLSFILYGIYRVWAYFTIGLHTLGLLFYILALQGILYNLDIGINLTLLTYVAWVGPSITTIVFLIFTYQFFSMKKQYKKFYYVMIGLMVFHAFVICVISYALFIDPIYIKYSSLTGISIIINSIYLLIAGIYMKEVGSKFYLLGQILLILAVLFSTLSIFGIITYYDIYRHLVSIALSIDIILLLIAQSFKTQHNLYLLNNSKIALMENSRFSSMGLAINNITHQWKHPLTHLGMSFTLIESVLKNKKEDEAIEYISDELPKVAYSIELMKKTLDEFSGYYSENIQICDFSPRDTANQVVHILNSKVLIKKAVFTLDIEHGLIMHDYEHIFSNILMILIDNSLDEFNSGSQENKISISIRKDNALQKYILIYTDNAGGIKIKPIDKVFEYFASTKKDNTTHGSGLAMVKMLIEERLNGQISVQNRDDGAEFTVLMPEIKNLDSE
ncbi:sensor histidine kinase [Candidatus Sulfurimonas baltica]|uniref:Sensor histidine kinase n=1 Tax=Candidatus Sulfurimonas baltica TaxID=2740404 RepID=A0A7S7LUC0_9BACT|nr:sensor histidine kinase [Candidatus Sulfurimonas baltica]QOY51003.1 sensor histidine kinase [Candidatus Sulfurimonas baltica]